MRRTPHLLRGASLFIMVTVGPAMLGRCSEFQGAGPMGGIGDAASSNDATPEVDGGTCSSAPYVVGQRIDRGSVCGVGGCRVWLSGDCAKASRDGGTPSVCAAAFPPEECATPTDENCDGVFNEGCEGIAATAGTRCVGCAQGEHVKRSADGTITGQQGNYQDAFTTTDCINSTLCSFGEPRWIRNMAGAGISCSSFCAQIGGQCTSECTTSQPPCDPAAASVNQSGKRFGTFAGDYGCMEMGSNGAKTGTPNTGACDFVPSDHGFGPLADNRFSYMCCCTL